MAVISFEWPLWLADLIDPITDAEFDALEQRAKLTGEARVTRDHEFWVGPFRVRYSTTLTVSTQHNHRGKL